MKTKHPAATAALLFLASLLCSSETDQRGLMSLAVDHCVPGN